MTILTSTMVHSRQPKRRLWLRWSWMLNVGMLKIRSSYMRYCLKFFSNTAKGVWQYVNDPETKESFWVSLDGYTISLALSWSSRDLTELWESRLVPVRTVYIVVYKLVRPGASRRVGKLRGVAGATSCHHVSNSSKVYMISR